MQITNSSLASMPSIADVKAMEFAAGNNAEEVASSLESVFASMLIKEMRNTLSEGLFGSEQSDVFGGMFDLHMGQAMTEGRGLGIRDMVLAQIESQTSPANPPTKAKP